MKYDSGQSLLALVILIGGIVAMIGVTLAFSAGAFSASERGAQGASAAEAAATGGAEDALLQLDRNIAFSSAGYSVPVGSTTVMVTVTQNSPLANLITILSQAVVFGSSRNINVVVGVDASTSQPTIVSWQEI